MSCNTSYSQYSDLKFSFESLARQVRVRVQRTRSQQLTRRPHAWSVEMLIMTMPTVTPLALDPEFPHMICFNVIVLYIHLVHVHAVVSTVIPTSSVPVLAEPRSCPALSDAAHLSSDCITSLEAWQLCKVLRDYTIALYIMGTSRIQ